MKNIVLILLSIFLLFELSGCSDLSKSDEKELPDLVSKKDFKILFIGNSFTFYNDGVDYHLLNMLKVDKSADSILYHIQNIAESSYTLEAHYNDIKTINKIKSNKWNLVILQEQSTRPVNNPDLFLEFASKLNSEIKNNGSLTALYLTWAVKDSPSEIGPISSAYEKTGTQINAKVVPVGKVWDYFVKNNSTIDLYSTDRKHPSLSGTFLTACVFYQSLFAKNPVENSYIPVGLTADNVVLLKKITNDYFKINP